MKLICIYGEENSKYRIKMILFSKYYINKIAVGLPMYKKTYLVQHCLLTIYRSSTLTHLYCKNYLEKNIENCNFSADIITFK